MIVVKIFQGPGNQMFQIAFGLAAAARLKTELKVDLTWYQNNSHHRQYILDKFNIEIQEASRKEIYDIVTCNGPNFIAYKWNQLNRLYLSPYYRRPKIVESYAKCDLNYKRIADNTYIQGYFSSRDFFDDQISLIKQKLSFKAPPSEKNKKTIEQIEGENAVAVSFRLGDFLLYPWHNVCSLQYYHRAVKYLSERYTNLKFYVFSDDVAWIKANFSIAYPVLYMDYNTPDYMEDFRLLTHFKYHIIPNSTFSWWGALLAPDAGKVVLAPEYWLHPDKSVYTKEFGGKVVDFSRVVPQEWIKIPNMVTGDTYPGK